MEKSPTKYLTIISGNDPNDDKMFNEEIFIPIGFFNSLIDKIYKNKSTYIDLENIKKSPIYLNEFQYCDDPMISEVFDIILSNDVKIMNHINKSNLGTYSMIELFFENYYLVDEHEEFSNNCELIDWETLRDKIVEDYGFIGFAKYSFIQEFTTYLSQKYGHLEKRIIINDFEQKGEIEDELNLLKERYNIDIY